MCVSERWTKPTYRSDSREKNLKEDGRNQVLWFCAGTAVVGGPVYLPMAMKFKLLKKGISKRGVVELRSLIGRLRRLNRFANHPVPKYPSGLGDENPMWHLLVGATYPIPTSRQRSGPKQNKTNKQWTNERMNEWMNGENQPLHCLCLISMCFWSTYLDGSSRESKCYKNHCGSH